MVLYYRAERGFDEDMSFGFRHNREKLVWCKSFYADRKDTPSELSAGRQYGEPGSPVTEITSDGAIRKQGGTVE